MVIERGENLLKRNVGHVKRFIDPAPRASQPLEKTPAMKPVILTDPEPSVIPAEGPVSEPAAEPDLPQPVTRIPEQTVEPRRSMRKRAEPSWLKDYVT